jgi:hypothetical protein
MKWRRMNEDSKSMMVTDMIKMINTAAVCAYSKPRTISYNI